MQCELLPHVAWLHLALGLCVCVCFRASEGSRRRRSNCPSLSRPQAIPILPLVLFLAGQTWSTIEYPQQPRLELPGLPRAGIEKIRATYLEKEDGKKLKQKQV